MQIKTTIVSLIVSASMFFLAGCVSKVEEAHIPPHFPKSGQSQLALLKPQIINLESVKDFRTSLEGKRESLGVPMGDIIFVPQIVRVIEDVVMSEFKNAGHNFSKTDQTLTLKVKIKKFDVATDSTPLYWDINGDTKIEIDVSGRNGESASFCYASICSDRTYTWPSGELFKSVSLECIDDFANKLRNDKGLVKAIKDMTDN